MQHHCVRRWLAAALLLSTLGAAGGVQAKVVERIVAVVNKNILLLSQVNERVRPMVPQLQQIPDVTMRKQRLKQLRRQVLDHLIDEALIKHEARKLKLKISDKDLELAIKDVMRKNKLTREQLEAALQQEGKSIAAYKQKILGPQLLRMRVVNVQVRSRVAVTQDEIKALYQKNLRALGVETKVRARHIFVVIPAGANGKKVMERRRYAVSLAGKGRKKGADFAALAKKYSEDSVTRSDGGDLGYFSRGTLPANIEAVVFGMKKGDIRGPMRTERGYHVIKLVDRKESSARPLSEVKEELRNQIYMKKVEKATKAWLKELRKKSYVDIKV